MDEFIARFREGELPRHECVEDTVVVESQWGGCTAVAATYAYYYLGIDCVN